MAQTDHILFLLSRLQDCAYRFISIELHKRSIDGIEPSHGAILRQLAVYGPLPMNRIARLIDRTKPTVTTLVNKLAKYGYVERISDPADGRVSLIRLTSKAKRLENDFRKVSDLMRERMYRGMTKEIKQELVDRLEVAIKNFKNE